MKITKVLMMFLAVMALSAHARAAQYVVDHAQSTITFSGTPAGAAFKGTFETWDAQINFDPANLAASTIVVTIDTASAKTGNAMYDGTLPTADWFDVKTYPKAVFSSTAIAANPAGGFSAEGTLTIRDKTQPVKFDFTLSDLATAPVKTSFNLKLDRLAFGIGEKSDAKAEWVSREIPLDVVLVVSPTP